jgi:uncharacterized protein YecE (DUF72 family)
MKINDTEFYIGTSGYKYEDWKDTFYPPLKHNYEMLEFYSKKFNFLEITFTFYKIPIERTIASLLERVGNDFKFSVRLTKLFLKNKYTDEDLENFKAGIEPLIKANKLIAIYADFNYDFAAKKSNFEYLCKLKKDFSFAPFFVELPNATWHKEKYTEDLRSQEIGMIITDNPNIRGLAPYHPVSTNFHTYFRFYGKNKLWLTPEDKLTEYNYSIKEMRKFKDDALKLAISSKAVIFSFCNVPLGNAPKNAEQFLKILKRPV